MVRPTATTPVTCEQCKVSDGDETREKDINPMNRKHGYEQQGRDDEEEYSRIPIAGESESDYDTDYIDDIT